MRLNEDVYGTYEAIKQDETQHNIVASHLVKILKIN